MSAKRHRGLALMRSGWPLIAIAGLIIVGWLHEWRGQRRLVATKARLVSMADDTVAISPTLRSDGHPTLTAAIDDLQRRWHRRVRQRALPLAPSTFENADVDIDDAGMTRWTTSWSEVAGGAFGPGRWMFDPTLPGLDADLAVLVDDAAAIVDFIHAESIATRPNGALPHRLWVWQAASAGDPAEVIRRSEAWRSHGEQLDPIGRLQTERDRYSALLSTMACDIWTPETLEQLRESVSSDEDLPRQFAEQLRGEMIEAVRQIDIQHRWAHRVTVFDEQAVLDLLEERFRLWQEAPTSVREGPLGQGWRGYAALDVERPPSMTDPGTAGDLRFVRVPQLAVPFDVLSVLEGPHLPETTHRHLMAAIAARKRLEADPTAALSTDWIVQRDEDSVRATLSTTGWRSGSDLWSRSDPGSPFEMRVRLPPAADKP